MRPGGVGTSRMIESDVTDLPQPGSADNAQRLAFARGKAYAVDSGEHAAAGGEFGAQIANFEEGSHGEISSPALLRRCRHLR